jgi:hypothetical protein
MNICYIIQYQTIKKAQTKKIESIKVNDSKGKAWVVWFHGLGLDWKIKYKKEFA